MNKNNIYDIGVERESLRCNSKGELSKSTHYEVFGDKVSDKFITRDFGEAQLELRTPVCDTVQECYNKLEDITNISLQELNSKGELLWPYSMPCILPEEKDFPFGNYGDKKLSKYKEYLSKKYHYTKRAISGIHVSFSIKKDYYKYLQENYKFLNLPDEMDEAYIRIMKNYMEKVWVLTYLLSASPVSYNMNNGCVASIRNSTDGFQNLIPIDLSFENKKEHINSIRKYIKNKELYSLSELYYPIRAKTYDGSDNLDKLEEGIKYVEARVFDINPFDKCGISKEQLEFIMAFMFSCLFDKKCNTYDYKEISRKGLNDKQYLEVLSEIENISEVNKLLKLGFETGINKISDMLKNNELGYEKVNKLVKEEGYLKGFISLAESYAKKAAENEYTISGYPYLEPSTVVIIKEAIMNGINANILDEKKCIVELRKGDKREIVVQATRTSKDSSGLQYIVNDKYVAKNIMQKSGINVPEGTVVSIDMDANTINEVIEEYINIPIVIKPKSTNFGTGITIFQKGANQEQIKKAIEYSLKFDDTVLIENYIKGKEYRFLVIDNKCATVTWRRNASIVGDGKSNIEELITAKNNETWHKFMHSQIKSDNGLKEYFSKNKILMTDIPKIGERVTLRGNSNVSSGGESIDMTDIMPQYFKEIAEKVSKCFNAKICGVDIIIDDMEKENCTVLEVNSNPGIYIQRWPYEGEERRIGFEILKLLDMID